MGLSNELQSSKWMYLNGIIIVSPDDYKLYNTNQHVYSAINLPYFTAAAWYTKYYQLNYKIKIYWKFFPNLKTMP